MRFAFYCAVLLVAAGSVMFGLDWMSAPMAPMPQPTRNVVFVPPPPPPPVRVATSTPAVSASPASPSTTPAITTPQTPVAAAPPVQTPPAPVQVAVAPKLKCDIDACARAYRSFQESDCTYNPSFGPRRLCTKGDPEKYAREHSAPAVSATPAAPEATGVDSGSIAAPEPSAPAAAAPRCNVSACAASYPRSFKEADCTFQPGNGPRRVCEK